MKKRPKPDEWYALQKVSRLLQASADKANEAQAIVQGLLCRIEHPEPVNKMWEERP